MDQLQHQQNLNGTVKIYLNALESVHKGREKHESRNCSKIKKMSRIKLLPIIITRK